MTLESLCDKQMTRALHLNPQIAARTSSARRYKRALAKHETRMTWQRQKEE